jgi:hypothetical protein
MTGRDDILKELIFELSRKIDDIRDDLAVIKEDLSGDLSELKNQQADCKRNWNYVSGLLGWIVAPVSGVGLLGWVSEKLHLIPKQ